MIDLDALVVKNIEEKGIVVIDEIDKICVGGSSSVSICNSIDKLGRKFFINDD